MKKRQATKFPRDGSEDKRYKDSGDGEERREERAKAEGVFGKADMLGASTAGSDFSSTHAAFGPNFGSRKTTGGITLESLPALATITTSATVIGSNYTGGFKFGGSLAGAPETDAVAAAPLAGEILFGAPLAAAPASTALDLTMDPVARPIILEKTEVQMLRTATKL